MSSVDLRSKMCCVFMWFFIWFINTNVSNNRFLTILFFCKYLHLRLSVLLQRMVICKHNTKVFIYLFFVNHQDLGIL